MQQPALNLASVLSPGVSGLKAEFEAEGARFDDLVLFSNVAHVAQVPLVIKIGGCEAISDLNQAKMLGAGKVVAPMVESPFALKKYADALTKVYGEGRENRPVALFNVETAQSAAISHELLDAAVEFGIDGVVVGRGDLTESLGLPRPAVESDAVTVHVRGVLEAARDRGLVCGFGGGVSKATAGLAVQLATDGALDYFETRKVLIRTNPGVTVEGLRSDILSALRFELAWLEQKRETYAQVLVEDDGRIERLGTVLEQG